MAIKKQTILIIGGSGFLGRRLLELAPKDAYVIHSTYLSEPTGIASVDEHRMDMNDIGSTESLLSEIEPDVVICLAKSPLWNTDDSLFRKVFEAFVKKIKDQSVRLIFFSTDAVFDGTKGMYTEKDTPHPPSPYGRWKKEAEDIIQNDLPTAAIIRTNYIYGRNGKGVDKRTQEVLDAVAAKKEIQRFSDMYRSVTFVDDLASATWRLVSIDFSGIIHIAGLRMSLLDFYRTVVQVFGHDSCYVVPQAIDEATVFGRDTSLDSALAKKILQFSPSVIDRSWLRSY